MKTALCLMIALGFASVSFAAKDNFDLPTTEKKMETQKPAKGERTPAAKKKAKKKKK